MSSSYCILGMELTTKDFKSSKLPEELKEYWDQNPGDVIEALLQESGSEGKEFWWNEANYDEDYEEDYDDEDYDEEEELELPRKVVYYVGKRVEDLDLDKTIRESAIEIKKKLSKIFKLPENKINIDWHYEET
jgi:hypothetical protein